MKGVHLQKTRGGVRCKRRDIERVGRTRANGTENKDRHHKDLTRNGIKATSLSSLVDRCSLDELWSVLRAEDLIDTLAPALPTSREPKATHLPTPLRPKESWTAASPPLHIKRSSSSSTRSLRVAQRWRFGSYQPLFAAKWEALALTPAYDCNGKDDYFLFTLVRNHPITLQRIFGVI